MISHSLIYDRNPVSLSIEVCDLVPLDRYLIVDGVIYVHPDSKETFMNLLRMEFPDPDGHKAFAL